MTVINLNWNHPDTESVQYFDVVYSINNLHDQVSTSTTSFQISANTGDEVTAKVRAVNKNGNSPFTDTVTYTVTGGTPPIAPINLTISQ